MADEYDQDAQAEKTEEPSQHRIDQFRKRGEVASSKELTNVLLLSVCIMTLGLCLVYMYEVLDEYIRWLYNLNTDVAYTEKSQKTILSKSIYATLKCVAPIFLSSICVGFIANLIQVGFLFAPEVLTLKLDRINPVKGFKKLFSIRSLLEAVKGVFKFAIILSILFFFIKDEINSYSGFLHLDTAQTFLYAKFSLIKLAMGILFGLIVVAIGDFAYQKLSYKKKLMQTKEEVKREQKEQEGNPEVRQRIRTIQKEMAQRRMMTDVPKADFVVTNPTHISVALKYNAEDMVSPQVIGKGADHQAKQIRKIAKQHNIPCIENVPLARTLYSTVKIGEYIPRSLYKAIAEVLAFVYRLKRKEKALK